MVSVVGSGGASTIAEDRNQRKGDLHKEALEDPLVQAVLEAFPGAEVREVRALDDPEDMAAAVEYETQLDDDWDPFDSA